MRPQLFKLYLLKHTRRYPYFDVFPTRTGVAENWRGQLAKEEKHPGRDVDNAVLVLKNV